MDRDQLIEAFAKAAAAEPRLDALLLGGSLGRGDGDRFSDVDLIVVARPDTHADLVAGIRAWASAVAEPVLWRQVYPGLPLFHAVTADYHRYDITVTVAARLDESADRVRPLLDRAGVHAALAPARARPEIAPAALWAEAEEFLRIVGLMPVAFGRDAWSASVDGVALLRQRLVNLMVLEARPVTPPGPLALGRALPARDIAILEALPAASANRASILAANLAVAEAFLPRAKALAAGLAAPWPDALEAAVRANLLRELDVTLPG